MDITHKQNAPRLICIGGLSGSGKTTLAAALTVKMDAVHLDSDIMRKTMFGIAPQQKLPPEGYTADATLRLIDMMMDATRAALSHGKTVIVSALFNDVQSRRRQEQLAQEAGVQLAGFILEGDETLLMERVRMRTNGVSDAGEDVLRRQLGAGLATASGKWQALPAHETLDVLYDTVMQKIANTV